MSVECWFSMILLHGRDVFSDGTGSAMKRVRPQSAAMTRANEGHDIFGALDEEADVGPGSIARRVIQRIFNPRFL
jgi:hypothetical protein